MAKLKLGQIADEKPVRITAELPAAVHRELVAYTDALRHETGQTVEPAQLVAPMLARFMAADRGFATRRRHSLRLKANVKEDHALEPELKTTNEGSLRNSGDA